MTTKPKTATASTTPHTYAYTHTTNNTRNERQTRHTPSKFTTLNSTLAELPDTDILAPLAGFSFRWLPVDDEDVELAADKDTAPTVPKIFTPSTVVLLTVTAPDALINDAPAPDDNAPLPPNHSRLVAPAP